MPGAAAQLQAAIAAAAAETPSLAAAAAAALELASSLSDAAATALVLADAPPEMSAYTTNFAEVVLPACVDGKDPAKAAAIVERYLTQHMQNIVGLPYI